jgi:hypothetical protein
MPQFKIQTGDGRKLTIEADTEDDALAEADAWETANPLPQREKYSMLGSGAMGAGDTFLAGGMDEIGGALGYVAGQGYESTRDSIREQQKLAQEDNPNSYMAGQIGGGVAQFAVPGTALIKGGSLAVNAARGAAGGAVAGGLYGVGSGTDIESRVAGGVMGAGLGAATGAAAPAVGRAAGLGLEKLRRVPQKGVSTIDELTRGGGARMEGTATVPVPKNAVSRLAFDSAKYIREAHVDPKRHPQAYEFDKALKQRLARARSNGQIDLGDIHNVRGAATDAIVEGNLKPQDAHHLGKLIDFYDQRISQFVPEYQKGIKEVATGKRAESILYGTMTKEGHPKPYEQVQKHFSDIASNPKAMKKFSEDEQAIIRKMAKGGRIGERAYGVLIAGTSGWAQAAAFMLGSAGGWSHSGPLGALMGSSAAVGVREMNKALKAARTRKAHKTVEELVTVARNNRNRPAPRTYPGLERATTAATVGTVPSQTNDLLEITVRPKRPTP